MKTPVTAALEGPAAAAISADLRTLSATFSRDDANPVLRHSAAALLRSIFLRTDLLLRNLGPIAKSLISSALARYSFATTGCSTHIMGTHSRPIYRIPTENGRGSGYRLAKHGNADIVFRLFVATSKITFPN